MPTFTRNKIFLVGAAVLPQYSPPLAAVSGVSGRLLLIASRLQITTQQTAVHDIRSNRREG